MLNINNYFLHLQCGATLARKEGITEGRAEGITEGIELGLIKLVCRKLIQNKPVSQIASELDEDPSHIQKICTAAKDSAPDYDVHEIYEKLMSLSQE